MQGKKTFYCLIVDHQDGGGSTTLYQSAEERLEALYESNSEYDPENHDYQDGELSEEVFGWMIDGAGNLHFFEDPYFHWGQ